MIVNIQHETGLPAGFRNVDDIARFKEHIAAARTFFKQLLDVHDKGFIASGNANLTQGVGTLHSTSQSDNTADRQRVFRVGVELAGLLGSAEHGNGLCLGNNDRIGGLQADIRRLLSHQDILGRNGKNVHVAGRHRRGGQ